MNCFFSVDRFAQYEETIQPRVSLLAEIVDHPGSLHELLRYFWKYDVNLTRIESRPSKREGVFEIFLDFHGRLGERSVDLLMSEIRRQTSNVLLLDEKRVPWFPRQISELDIIANRILVRVAPHIHTWRQSFFLNANAMASPGRRL